MKRKQIQKALSFMEIIYNKNSSGTEEDSISTVLLGYPEKTNKAQGI